MLVLVGSRAIKRHFPDFPREPKDIDYFVGPEAADFVEAEYFYQPMISKWYEDNYRPLPAQQVATPDELYTIKVSHAFWDLDNGSWEKHIFDTAFLKSKGAKIIEDFYQMLYSVWEERYGEKKANLEATPEEFFTNTVSRKYDHDSIHDSIAYHDEPLFNKILRDSSSVAVSKEKFFSLPDSEKFQLIREEIYATALERILIPADFKRSPGFAYQWALKKTITSFSKGWFPRFIVENYAEVRRPDINYVQRHKDNQDRLILLEEQ